MGWSLDWFARDTVQLAGRDHALEGVVKWLTRLTFHKA